VLLRLSVLFFAVAVGTKVVAHAGPLMTAPADEPAARGPSDTQAAVRAAAAAGRARGYRVAVAVLDRRKGAVYAAGDAAAYPSASVVKVFVAARLLADGRAGIPRPRTSCAG
jgi:hypothetical protein